MDGHVALRLDVFNTSLEGINLIEASAGTGKTYTITGLYLRLVLEAGYTVNQILVVTYTVAATEELRQRIRERLIAVRDAFITGESADTFCQRLLNDYADRQRAVRRLTNAVRGFDEAAIFTIHGFCQRVLAESAFESGMPFATELLPDQREILQGVVDDFWRRTFYQASPLFVGYLLDDGYSPDSLLQIVRPHVGKPFLQVLKPQGLDPDAKESEAAFAAAYRQVLDLWRAEHSTVATLLCGNPNLNASKYRKDCVVGWLALMDTYLRLETPNLALFDRFEKFTARCLTESVKKGKTPPEHAFFDACDRLAGAHAELIGCYERHMGILKARLLDYCNAELGVRKRREQVQSYDDLLINLYQALSALRGTSLAAAIRRRYPAALIDEFQDTDPVQYAIFRQIYAGHGPVFLVGDPKQAIYSFRGADIFAYLQGREDAGQRYTLDINYRSDAGLIDAVNALFGRARRPFLFEAIPFHPAEAADKDREPCVIEGMAGAPLRIWFLGQDEDGKPLDKGRAARLAAQTSAAEIARLLNQGIRGKARLGKRPLEGGDIAVLVRNHRQGRLVRDELVRLGVPSIQQAQNNVFYSYEALELERVLMAVAEPGREALLKAALATDLCGVSGEGIYQLDDAEQAWEAYLEAFREYHRLWRERGFMRMFRTWFSQEDVARRLLEFRDGERRLTNLLHLAELLQGMASRSHSGMEGVVKWLAERRRSGSGEDEEQQLRLESDENLVKIVTIHKSKGLEYPVVFCPFLWDGKLWSDDSNRDFSFHDPEQDYRSCLELGSERRDAVRHYARQEELAENLRLLYVALTRAQYRCYMVWGAIKGADTSAPAWLLHQPPGVDSDADGMSATMKRFKGLDEQALWMDLQQLERQANGAIGIEVLLEEQGRPYCPLDREELQFAARRFPGPLRDEGRVTSFSALAGGRAAELPDYDAGVEVPVAEPAPLPHLDIFSFPRGARAGSCLHAIFEYLDFTRCDRGELEVLVEKTLAEHGFEGEWVKVIADRVEGVLATPLDRAGRLRLQGVSLERRLNELEFYYPLSRLQAEELRRLLKAHGFATTGPWYEEIDRLTFAPVHGFMKGYIDLVFEADGRFYLVDYKSNWLGATPEAYREAQLPAVMARDAYYLQYLIYTLALHRFLSLRVPGYDYDAHFGGVFYLFVRGMDPNLGPGYGIYRDRPARALVEALDVYIETGEG